MWRLILRLIRRRRREGLWGRNRRWMTMSFRMLGGGPIIAGSIVMIIDLFAQLFRDIINI
jgi:hypothetical protein